MTKKRIILKAIAIYLACRSENPNGADRLALWRVTSWEIVAESLPRRMGTIHVPCGTDRDCEHRMSTKKGGKEDVV